MEGTVVIKENKSNLAKMWSMLVDSHINIAKAKLKMAPFTLKIVSVFAPEAAPVLVPLSKFLNTDTGKKLRQMGEKTEDALSAFLKGNSNEAFDIIKENFDISPEEVDSMTGDISNVYNNVKSGLKR